MVQLFYQGGPFMYPILFLLILGVAISIYKFWALVWASINTRKFMKKIKAALSEGGIDAATEVTYCVYLSCRSSSYKERS